MSLQKILNNLPILLIIFVSFVLPMAQKLYKAMKESAAKREAAMRRERAELELLRTGRGGATAESSAMESMQARAQQASTVPNPQPDRQTDRQPNRQPGAPATRQIRLPGGVVIEVPIEDAPARRQPSAGSPRAATPSSRSNKRAEGRGQRRSKQSGPKPAPAAVDPPPSDAVRAQVGSVLNSVTRAAVDARPAAYGPSARTAPAIAFLGQPLDRDALKRAFVLNEVLGRPVGER